MMKRFTFLTLALLIAITGAAWAQSPTTSAPTGQSMQTEPQPANNDLRNPGNPQNQVGIPPKTNTETTGTTTTTTDTTGTTGTTGSTTDTTGTTGMTGTTGSTSMDTTGSTTSSDTTGTTSSTTTTESTKLPRTGSEMPLVGIIGLLALVSAFGVRTYAKRNA
jgi:LPXTG-motif cell wall-anchored protein